MKEVFESYTAPELKKLIKAANITGYSKLKKDKLIELMLKELQRERQLKRICQPRLKPSEN